MSAIQRHRRLAASMSNTAYGSHPLVDGRGVCLAGNGEAKHAISDTVSVL